MHDRDYIGQELANARHDRHSAGCAERGPTRSSLCRAADPDFRHPISASDTPTDILPNIGIPVVAAVWSYNGLSPDDMSGRVVYYYERTLTSQVNDIQHMSKASLCSAMAVVKIFFQPSVEYQCGAGAGDGAASQTVLKQLLPPGITPPLCAVVQRLQRADPATGAVQQDAVANQSVRLTARISSARSWRPCTARHPVALWRQGAADADRLSTSMQLQSLWPVGGRMSSTALASAEPDHPGRHGKGRQVRVESWR